MHQIHMWQYAIHTTTFILNQQEQDFFFFFFLFFFAIQLLNNIVKISYFLSPKKCQNI